MPRCGGLPFLSPFGCSPRELLVLLNLCFIVCGLFIFIIISFSWNKGDLCKKSNVIV